MNYSFRSIIREFIAPNHRISCSTFLWKSGIEELKTRGKGMRESGAFLLGRVRNGRCRVEHFVYYDDLEPNCLSSGIVVLNGSGYGPLWQLCRETNLKVVADIHTHPAKALQSHIDKENPMIATIGHIALIVPHYAQDHISQESLGIYEYLGSHQWRDHSGKNSKAFMYIGIWG